MSTLCNTCSPLFSKGSAELYFSKRWYKDSVTGEDADIIWHTLHDSKQAFDRGIASGCELCRSIADAIPTDSSRFRTSFSMRHAPKLHCDQLDIIDSSDPNRVPDLEDESTVTFDIKPHQANTPLEPLHSAAIAASKSPCTGADKTLDMAYLWLTECTTRHEYCTRPVEPTWYPTRLLEISGEKVKLIVTAEKKIEGHYFTLSYVWGNPHPPLWLTPDTETQLRSGVEILSQQNDLSANSSG